METEVGHDVVEQGQESDVEVVDLTEVDDGGTGAAVAMLIALATFLLAVVFVIVRHALFLA